jgi:hypothetical protein
MSVLFIEFPVMLLDVAAQFDFAEKGGAVEEQATELHGSISARNSY